MKHFLIFLIRLYQKTLSPDTGWFSYRYPYSYCRFSPTCSQYMVEALERFGALRGFLMGIQRVFRCHPWSQGGYDPVSKKTDGHRISF